MTRKSPLPGAGGSYVRGKDGTLTRATGSDAAPKPVAAPAKPKTKKEG